MGDGRLLDVAVVARYLGTSSRHVRNLIQRGELRAQRVGGRLRKRYRVRESDVLAFLGAKIK